MSESEYDVSAEELTVHSRLRGAIQDLSTLEQSLLFAELSHLSYYDPGVVEPPLTEIGFSESQFFERDGAQAWIFASERDCVVACRGTEPNEWNDIRADVNAVAVFTETFGRVHRGFNEEVDDLWPRLETALRNNHRRLWFTGHSLGGAMATICAGRCFLSEIESLPWALFTYGSPRVGDRRFVNFVELNHTRWVNNNDIVTRVPPVWMGYRHSGQEMYLDRHGQVRAVKGWGRLGDRTRGFLGGLLRLSFDHFSDHSMERYIEFILAAAAEGGFRGAAESGGLMNRQRLNVLFVCSRNQWRSPTAERVWRDDGRLNVRSRGVSDRAVRRMTSRDVDWADVILVMEWEHRARIREQFGRQLGAIPVRVLEIPDEYRLMDPELVDLLHDRVGQALEEFLPGMADGDSGSF